MSPPSTPSNPPYYLLRSSTFPPLSPFFFSLSLSLVIFLQVANVLSKTGNPNFTLPLHFRTNFHEEWSDDIHWSPLSISTLSPLILILINLNFQLGFSSSSYYYSLYLQIFCPKFSVHDRPTSSGVALTSQSRDISGALTPFEMKHVHHRNVNAPLIHAGIGQLGHACLFSKYRSRIKRATRDSPIHRFTCFFQLFFCFISSQLCHIRETTTMTVCICVPMCPLCPGLEGRVGIFNKSSPNW